MLNVKFTECWAKCNTVFCCNNTFWHHSDNRISVKKYSSFFFLSISLSTQPSRFLSMKSGVWIPLWTDPNGTLLLTLLTIKWLFDNRRAWFDLHLHFAKTHEWLNACVRLTSYLKIFILCEWRRYWGTYTCKMSLLPDGFPPLLSIVLVPWEDLPRSSQ